MSDITDRLYDWDNNPTRVDCAENGGCVRCEAVDTITELRAELVEAEARIRFLDTWVKELMSRSQEQGHTPLS